MIDASKWSSAKVLRRASRRIVVARHLRLSLCPHGAQRLVVCIPHPSQGLPGPSVTGVGGQPGLQRAGDLLQTWLARAQDDLCAQQDLGAASVPRGHGGQGGWGIASGQFQLGHQQLCHAGRRHIPLHQLLQLPCPTAGRSPIAQLAAAQRCRIQDTQVIITGRVADPALFLAPLMHHFGWAPDDWQSLGKGVLVGHLLECAAQITGGYFADPGYKDVPQMARLGFPLAEVSASGDAVITKVAGSGGWVTVATCTEQLLYEIENPARYLQPDVVADFSQVQLTQVGPDRVQVTGGNGHPCTDTFKVTLGYRDGFIGEGQMSYAGPGAQARGQLALDLVRQRLADAGYAELESRYDLIGVNAIFGASGQVPSEPAEVRARVALRVPTLQQAQHVAHEVEALYLNGPAGGGGATRSVREVIAAAAVLMPRSAVHTTTVLLTQDH
eukprot:gene33150-40905_t